MIRPERIHELAVEISARRANDALDRTPDGIVYRLISGLDDIAPMPDREKRKLAAEIADFIRTGRAVVVYPDTYVGKGDGEPAQPDLPDAVQACGETTKALIPTHPDLDPCTREHGHPGGHRNKYGTEWHDEHEQQHREAEYEHQLGVDESLSGDPDYGHDLDDHREG